MKYRLVFWVCQSFSSFLSVTHYGCNESFTTTLARNYSKKTSRSETWNLQAISRPLIVKLDQILFTLFFIPWVPGEIISKQPELIIDSSQILVRPRTKNISLLVKTASGNEFKLASRRNPCLLRYFSKRQRRVLLSTATGECCTFINMNVLIFCTNSTLRRNLMCWIYVRIIDTYK